MNTDKLAEFRLSSTSAQVYFYNTALYLYCWHTITFTAAMQKLSIVAQRYFVIVFTLFH